MTNAQIKPLLAPRFAEDFALLANHYSDRSPERLRSRGTGRDEAVELRPIGVGRDCVALLERWAEVRGDDALSEVTNALTQHVDRYGEHLLFDEWCRETAPRWAADRCPALAAVIEAGARLDIGGLGRAIALVLCDASPDPLVFRIAVHRARHLRFVNESDRARAWQGLSPHLASWLASDDPALAPLVPSVAHLGGLAAVDPLSSWVGGASRPLATSAARGLLDLFDGNTRPALHVPAQVRRRVVEQCIDRWRRTELVGDPPHPTADLGAALIRLMATGVTADTRAAVVEAMVEAFRAGRGDQPAAAILAARSCLQGDRSDEAARALGAALESRLDAAQRGRFWGLVVRGVAASWR